MAVIQIEKRRLSDSHSKRIVGKSTTDEVIQLADRGIRYKFVPIIPGTQTIFRLWNGVWR